MSEEETRTGPVRLSKLIAARGLASRREAEAWIAEGRVTVNGHTADGTQPADPAEDDIRVDGRRLPPEPRKVYYLFYKPRGCITGRNDPQGRASIFDLIGELAERVEPVGRLDFDTEGALILTNDGTMAHELAQPHTKVPRRYAVKVYRQPNDAKLQMIRDGRVFLEDGATQPALVRVMEETDTANTWLEVTVTENRNRLIRRMFQQLHHPVSKLRRESFGTISVRGMERGDLRPLTHDEVKRLEDLARGVKPARAGKKRKGKGFAKAKPKTRVQARKSKNGKRRKP